MKRLTTQSIALIIVLSILAIALSLVSLARWFNTFKHELAKRPDLITSHRALGGIYLKQSNKEDALTHLTRALELGDLDATFSHKSAICI